ncbi:MAG: hypothetical protein ACYS8W_14275 [Planctomycetota bacterium]|jgi:hypothetical protein
MVLQYTKHNAVKLQNHPDFNEKWLQDLIADDPTILGLGSVGLLDRERKQHTGGRLDLLLSDISGGKRYEVEIMLGATNPDHIVRCLEYWDVERRRYPAYDHIAVLVAEDLTSRFLNTMSLFAGSVPFIAIQLCALEVDGKIILNFVKVLDEKSLRRDDETPVDRQIGKAVSRQEWVAYTGEANMKIVDATLEWINEKAKPARSLAYRQQHIGLSDGLRVSNFIWFEPKKPFVRVGFKVSNSEEWNNKLEELGLPSGLGQGSVSVTVRPSELDEFKDVLRELTHKTVGEYME